jgi:DNA polymerase-1
VTGWNVSFDAAWCIAAGLETEVFACKWLDAMLLWRHVFIQAEDEETPRNKRKSYSLENAIKEFFPGEGDFKEFKNFQATDAASLQDLLRRNEGDARLTLKLAELFWSMLTPKQRNVALIEARCIPQVAWTKVHGIRSSRLAAVELSEKLLVGASALEKELYSLSPEAAGVNFASPKQLQTLLYDTWGLPLTRSSKKGSPSTDKYALFDLAPLDPRAKMLKELREAKNNRIKYAEATIKSLDYNGDGCVRPQASIFGTYTARMTYRGSDRAEKWLEKTYKRKSPEQILQKVEVPVGVALHQWKRGKEYRRLIQAPEGLTLVELDFAGQEFRWMAVASGDETMLSLCAPGEDAHSYMGAQISEIEYRELIRRVKESDEYAALQRKLGKFANLSFQYRVSARTATLKARVDYELEVDETFIKQILATYKQTFPGVGGLPQQRDGGYWGRQIRECKQRGYAETFAGRRVQLIGDWCGRTAWPLESTAINYRIQGTGADQKYLALAVARNELNQFGGYFYYELHDGLFFIFPNDKAESAARHLHDKLSNLPYKAAWGVDLPIDFPVDTKTGPTWGDLKELK